MAGNASQAIIFFLVEPPPPPPPPPICICLMLTFPMKSDWQQSPLKANPNLKWFEFMQKKRLGHQMTATDLGLQNKYDIHVALTRKAQKLWSQVQFAKHTLTKNSIFWTTTNANASMNFYLGPPSLAYGTGYLVRLSPMKDNQWATIWRFLPTIWFLSVLHDRVIK